jgi:MYXO-CTERM domain-containing protein
MSTFAALALLALPLHAAPLCPELEPVLAALDETTPCLTPAIRAAWLAAESPEQRACVGQAMAERGLPSRPLARGRASEGHRSPMPELWLRDPYDLPNQAFSEHFVLLWGDDTSVSESRASSILSAFETGYDNHVEAWGMPVPDGMDEFYFNVYVGDSGDGAPGISGAAGYFTTDGDDYPMIVLSPDILNNSQYRSTTAVHEFFHATQWATGNYVTWDSMWFWEATASWCEGAVFPTYDDYAWPLPGFAFLPHLSLKHFDYPDRGTLEEMHHYGAFIWPRYITEYIDDDELTIEVWKMGSAGADPLYYYADSIYRASGLELEDAWGDFLGRNAVWDYQDRDLYLSILDMYDNYYDDESISASYSGGGLETWAGGRENLPHNFGSNTILLNQPQAGVVRFEFEGERYGSMDSVSEWEIRVVLVQGESFEYVEVPLQGDSAAWASDGSVQYDQVFAVIGAWAATWYEGETFDYQYRIWVEGAFGDTGLGDTGEDEPGGCGCSSGRGAGAAGLAWLGLLGLGAALRRRR